MTREIETAEVTEGPVGLETYFTIEDEEDPEELDPDSIFVEDIPFETYVDDLDAALLDGSVDLTEMTI